MNSVFVVKQNPKSLFAKKYKTHIPVDKRAMKKIIDSGWNRTYEDSQDWCRMYRIPGDTLSAIGHLQMIYNQVVNKPHNNLYCTLQQKQIGRAYYDKAICLSSLPREVRQALSCRVIKIHDDDTVECEDLLYDYDIANAQPNILYQMCEKAGLSKNEYKHIRKYCKNRDKFLLAVKEQLMLDYDDNWRTTAKGLWLVALNQGSIQNYVENVGCTYEEHKDSGIIIAVEEFKREVKNIFLKYFKLQNQPFFAEILIKKENIKSDALRSFIARILQHKECEVVEGVISELIKTKQIKKGRFDYAFDGFLAVENIDTKVLDKITKELGWNLTWTKKEPTEGIELWSKVNELTEGNKEPVSHPKDTLDCFDDDHFKTLYCNYKKLKDYFELFYTFVKNPEPMFVYRRYKSFVDGKTGDVKKQYVITYHKEADLKKTYKNIHSRIEFTKHGEKKIQFLEEYMDDLNMVKKEEMEFYPQNTNKPKAHNKRYLNTFTGYNDDCFEEGIKLKPYVCAKRGILHNFMMVVKNLVGGRKERKIFLYLLAYKIKYPARKLPFAVLIKGHQGSGKNTILEQISKIIGEAHYNTTANLKDITGDYAEGMMNKLLVNLNEINFNDAKGKADLLKSLISEDRMSFNVKYCRPIVQNVYALIVATTNNVCSMKLDIVSGERRWFIFESNGKNKKLCAIIDKENGKNGWDAVHKEWERPEFIQQLYLYLMSLPVEKFNFQQAQYKMASTPAYNRLASYFVPNMALMLKDFILLNAYKHIKNGSYHQAECMIDFEEDEEEEEEAKAEEPKKKEYYEYDDFYNVFECKSKELHNWYREWYDKFGGNDDFKKNAKKFQNSIMALSLKSISKVMMTGNNVGFVFKPYSVIRELNELKLINVDITKWRSLIEFDDDESEDDWDF